MSACWLLPAACLFAGPAPAPPADPLPPGAVAVLGGQVLRPEGRVIHLGFRPDGRSLLTVCQDGTLQTWDRGTGRERRRLALPAGSFVFAAALSGDGQTVVLAVGNGTVRFFAVDSGKAGAVLSGPDALGVQHLSLSKDGKTLATANGRDLVVWDVPRARAVHRRPGEGHSAALAMTPDGKQLLLARPDHSLRLLECATGKEVRRLESDPADARRVPAAVVRYLAISPDGRLAAAGDGFAQYVTVYSLETGKQTSRLQRPNSNLQGLAFSPSGRLLVAAGYPGVHVFGTLSGRELRRLDAGHALNSTLVAVAPDGRTVAALVQDGGLLVWDAVEGRLLLAPVGHSAPVQKLVFLGAGKRLASQANDGRLLHWDIASARILDEQPGLPLGDVQPTPTPDGQGVQGVGYDGRLHTWRPGSVTSEPVPLPGQASPRQTLSRGGKFLARFGPDNKLRVWDLRPKVPLERDLSLPPQPFWINYMVLSDDGRHLAAACGDGALRVWDCFTGKPVRPTTAEVPAGPVMAYGSFLQFSADGRSLLLFNNQLRLIEVVSGQERVRLANGPTGIHAGAALSANGRLLAQGSADGTVFIYATATGQELARHKGRQGIITSLAFCENSRLLASGGANGGIIIWKMPEPAPVKTVLSREQAEALWRQLAEDNAGSAARAIESLVSAPGPAVAVIRERLRPRSARLDPQRLTKLIADLDSDVFEEREKASQELGEAGAAAEDLLRKTLDKDPSPEVRRRVHELLDRLQNGSAAPERLRAVRAVEVLERIGMAEARAVLEELRKVGDPALAEEAQASLQRLSKSP